MATVDIIVRMIDQTGAVSNKTIANLKSMAAGFVSYAAVAVAAGKALNFVITQAAEAELVNAKLEAALKSTGGAAGMTADELDKLAVNLSRMSIYDDEAIKGSEALLLTFTKISKETFPEAEQAILNVASAMGGDLQGATIQVGKALNDPILGLTSLSRAGIQFTDEQKKMIKTLVETGDTLGAQKIILSELTTQFGGQAAAAANTYTGRMTQLKNEVGNLGETVGNDLLPDLIFLVKNLREGVEWTNKNYEALKKWGNGILWIINPFMQLSKIAGKGLRGLVEDTDAAGNAVDEFGNSTSSTAADVAAFAESERVANLALAAQEAVIKSAEDALNDYKDMLDEVSQANLDMESTSREVADFQKGYDKDHADSIENLREKQREYFDAVYEFGKNSEEALSASEGVAEAQKGIQELEATWHESANNMIYDMILVGVSAGGLLDSEQKALDEYAVKAGIKTQADIDEANRRREIADSTIAGILQSEDVLAEQKRVDAETERLTNEIVSSEAIAAAGEQEAAINNVTASIDSATQSYIAMAEAARDVAATASSIPPVSGGSSTPPSTGGGNKRDSGGWGMAGVEYMIGTGAQPEKFTPTQNGYFTPNADKKGAGGGATYIFNITNAKPESSENSIRTALKNLQYLGVAE